MKKKPDKFQRVVVNKNNITLQLTEEERKNNLLTTFTVKDLLPKHRIKLMDNYYLFMKKENSFIYIHSKEKLSLYIKSSHVIFKYLPYEEIKFYVLKKTYENEIRLNHIIEVGHATFDEEYFSKITIRANLNKSNIYNFIDLCKDKEYLHKREFNKLIMNNIDKLKIEYDALIEKMRKNNMELVEINKKAHERILKRLEVEIKYSNNDILKNINFKETKIYPLQRTLEEEEKRSIIKEANFKKEHYKIGAIK